MKQITLSDGRIAEIKEGKGKHAKAALRQMDGDSSNYLPAIMAQLVTIDCKPVVMEDLDELPLRDFQALMSEVSDGNFTPSQPKS